mgnify:CR=1 FL=1
MEYHGILVGQTWSNFTSWNDWADSLDWNGAIGHSGGFRTNQVRYTYAMGEGMFSVALEDSAGTVTNAPANSAKVDFPNISARYEGKGDKFKYALGVVGQQFKLDNGSGNATPVNESQTGAGAMFNLSYDLSDQTSILGGVVGGDGMGDYIYIMPGSLSTYYDGAKIQTLSQLGATLAVSHKLDPKTDLAVSLGYIDTGVDSAKVADGFFNAATVENQKSALITYTFSPAKHLMYGGEIAHYWNTLAASGNTGSATRLQFSAKYSF